MMQINSISVFRYQNTLIQSIEGGGCHGSHLQATRAIAGRGNRVRRRDVDYRARGQPGADSDRVLSFRDRARCVAGWSQAEALEMYIERIHSSGVTGRAM